MNPNANVFSPSQNTEVDSDGFVVVAEEVPEAFAVSVEEAPSPAPAPEPVKDPDPDSEYVCP